MSPPSPAPGRPPAAPADLDALAAALAARLGGLLGAHAASPTASPPLLDLGGAAARLNVSERTVEALVAAGDIPVVRIGTGRGVRRFDPAALDAFVRRQTRVL